MANDLTYFNESSDTSKGVMLHSKGQITLLVGSFAVVLDIGDCTPKMWHNYACLLALKAHSHLG